MNAFPFFELPAELRNRICEFALTAEDPLEAASEGTDARPYLVLDPDDPQKAFNQLKNVNKQLRQETADLELRYNTLSFNHDNTGTPLDEVFNFIEFLGDEKRNWVRKIVLNPNLFGEPDPIQNWYYEVKRLDRLCCDNPHMMVRYLIYTEHYDYENLEGTEHLLYDMAMHLLQLRGVSLPGLKAIELDEEFQEQFEFWKEANETYGGTQCTPLVAPNLRFYPWRIKLDEELLEHIYLDMEGYDYAADWMTAVVIWAGYGI
ncbi:hypothetical protein DM02DRAFT_361385 [Periconia macrospinosa]|uniref:Uncharacterized protein n=1 Tax=Periconia macrospinosa TaxID=97972 RepID=A0A2V1DVH8_9PLEO|nr:hypothetical protein DM02DRAFT_361385 [Periconia macrospinosa]